MNDRKPASREHALRRLSLTLLAMFAIALQALVVHSHIDLALPQHSAIEHAGTSHANGIQSNAPEKGAICFLCEEQSSSDEYTSPIVTASILVAAPSRWIVAVSLEVLAIPLRPARSNCPRAPPASIT